MANLTRAQFLKLAGLGMAGTALAACGGTVSTGGTSGGGADTASADAAELNLYTWQEYVPPKVVDAFEEETGITINYSYFSTCEEMLAKLEATGGADYDVILATDYSLQIASDEGLLQKLDLSRIPNIQYVDPRLQNQYYDPDGDLSIPYWVSSGSIMWDPSKTDLTFESFADLADPSLAGQVVVVDSPRDVLGTAVVVAGYDFNTTDVAEIEAAKPFLEELRPSIEAFNTDSPEFVVTNGDAIASYATGAQSVAGIIADSSMKMSYPKECTTLGIDAFVVPSKAPHLDNVYTFLDFVTRPDIAALAVEHTHYHNSNIAPEYYEGIQEYVDLGHVALVPDEILDDFTLTEPLTAEAQQAYDELWTEFKQGA